MSRRHRLQISELARAQIVEYARLSNDGLETGGALFGNAPSSDIIEVGHAVGPGPKALRKADRFDRDLNYTRDRAQEIYRDSGQEWVGEWHTHPSGRLAPSPIDLRTYQNHLTDPELGFTAFVSVIVGPAMDWTSAATWIITTTATFGMPVHL